ncbi:MAG: polyprenyl synthetase family protein [Ruminococcus sp.]
MNFKEELRRRTEEVQKRVLSFLPKEEGFPAKLAEAVNYNMEAPGKRLRPLLMQEIYRMYGGEGTVVYPFMAAMEMIHTHSLIHDDLPALDNDDYRRGRKTTHKVYGEALAVLCGDALLNLAYETAFLAFSMDEDAAKTAKALRILGRKAGIYGMLGGQSVDVMNEGKELSRQTLDYIYENKTAALLEGSLMIGAVLAGASDQEVEKMERAGSCLGLAFQIQDDILDVTGSEEELGKPVHSDEKNKKTTYVTLEGVIQAEKTAQKLTQDAKELLTGERDEFLQALLDYLMVRKK